VIRVLQFLPNLLKLPKYRRKKFDDVVEVPAVVRLLLRFAHMWEILSRGLQQFAHVPDVIADPRRHRGRYSQRFVDAAEVVESVPERYSGPVVFPLFAEGVRQPSESAGAHTDGKILSFHDRGANAFRIGIATNWDHLRTGDFGRAVAGFAFARIAVDLDEHRVIDVISESVRDGRSVRGKSIGSDLERGTRRDGIADALDEGVRGQLVALTHCNVQHQLCVPLYSNERVAVAQVLIVFGTNALFLLADEAPQLVKFHVLHLHVADVTAHDAFTLLASENEQFQNRFLMNVCQTDHARNTVTFQQELQDEFGFVNRQVHTIQGVVAGIREHLPALRALVALAIPTLPKAATFGTAVVAGHADLDLSSGPVQNRRGHQKSLPHGFGLRLRLAGSFNYLRGFVIAMQPQRGRRKSFRFSSRTSVARTGQHPDILFFEQYVFSKERLNSLFSEMASLPGRTLLRFGPVRVVYVRCLPVNFDGKKRAALLGYKPFQNLVNRCHWVIAAQNEATANQCVTNPYWRERQIGKLHQYTLNSRRKSQICDITSRKSAGHRCQWTGIHRAINRLQNFDRFIEGIYFPVNGFSLLQERREIGSSIFERIHA
jgi:hypothetical protein